MAENAADCNIAGVLGTLPGIIGTFQANEAIKVILGNTDISCNKIILINTLQVSMRSINIVRNEQNWGSFPLTIEAFKSKNYQ
jgi:adenylyltransferase/sulfurtransferase